VELAESVPSFKRELPSIVAMLEGRDLRGLDGDRALQRCREFPVPVLSAAVSLTAARRAGRVGAGVILEGMSDPTKVAALCQAFDEAGGTQPKVLVRRVWLGQSDRTAIDNQRRFYTEKGNGNTPFGDDQTLASSDPTELAERIVAIQRETGVDAINLRVHLPGISAEAVRDQIVGLTESVLPEIRRLGVTQDS